MLTTATTNPRIKNRLLVLVPDSLAGDADFSNKIRCMAVDDACDILLLAFADDPKKIPSLTRDVARMNAVTAQRSVSVQTSVVDASLWLDALREVYRPGDQIVCNQEQSVRSGFLRTVPVSHMLRTEFDAPVITISGIYQPAQARLSQFLNGLALWVILAVILAFFTVLEFEMDQSLQGAVRKIMLMLLIVMECGAILIWDRVKGR